MTFAKLLSFLLTFLHVKGECLSGRCQKISLNVYRDAIQDAEFVGHVFHTRNSASLSPLLCYRLCIQDCRCLSLNFKENDHEKICELNEGNHFTNTSSLRHFPGSSYYHLHRNNVAKVNSVCTVKS